MDMKYALIALALIFTPLFFTNAQVGLGITNQGLVIDTEPLFPEPEEAVTANLNDYSLSGQSAGVKWKVDGKLIEEASNLRTIKFTAPSVGKVMVVEAVVEIAGGGTMVAKKVIEPVYLDIIVEPQTRTPAFYLGRALPSVGSQINLTAILNGNAVSPTGLLYTWKVNNEVAQGGTLRAGNKISIPTPQGQLVLITLDVSTQDGEVLARRTIEIPSVSPKIYFYEMNALYGQSYKPLSNLNLIGESVSVRAEPYYLDILTYNSPAHLEWKVDGTKSNKNTGNPYIITLAGQGGTGSSKVDFHVRNLTQLLQGGQGGFQINF
jgi:hypothetical protein